MAAQASEGDEYRIMSSLYVDLGMSPLRSNHSVVTEGGIDLCDPGCWDGGPTSQQRKGSGFLPATFLALIVHFCNSEVNRA